MDSDKIRTLIELALAEDIGSGDITTDSVVPEMEARAILIAKEEGVIAGMEVARSTFHYVDKEVEFEQRLKDGEKVSTNQIIASLKGRARSILKAERTALNFLTHLSGIATLTSKYVELTEPYGCKILDTRKTTPLMRELEKYAVRMGGGENHRFQLADMVLIKDNHLKLCPSENRVSELIQQVRKKIKKGVKIEVEVNSIKEAKEAYESCADIIMLDNMEIEEIARVVKLIEKMSQGGAVKRPILEVSGGVNLSNVVSIARTGVDWISVGEITHSAPALDISLEIVS